jgi:hypothetical protein
MKERIEDLPIEIRNRLASFIRVRDDGSSEIIDPRGFVDFVKDNAETYPALLDLITVDEERLTRHIEETGDIPPGIELIQTVQVEGENVTKLRITRGPARVAKEDLGEFRERKKKND